MEKNRVEWLVDAYKPLTFWLIKGMWVGLIPNPKTTNLRIRMVALKRFTWSKRCGIWITWPAPEYETASGAAVGFLSFMNEINGIYTVDCVGCDGTGVLGAKALCEDCDGSGWQWARDPDPDYWEDGPKGEK